jgi:phosphoserine phosphatase
LKNLYSQMFGEIRTFGVGDGLNDLPMLKVVDKPFFIERKTNLNSRLNAWAGILQLIGSNIVV